MATQHTLTLANPMSARQHLWDPVRFFGILTRGVRLCNLKLQPRRRILLIGSISIMSNVDKRMYNTVLYLLVYYSDFMRSTQ